MTTLSTASTHSDPWSRRLSYSPSVDVTHLRAEPMPMGATIPPLWPPAGLAADDLPRGKILVVEDEATVALDLQRMLREAGFRVAGPVATLQDVERLIQRGTIDCALLDLDVNQRTPLPVADLLAFADVPFVFVTSGGRAGLSREHLHRPVLKKPFDQADLIAALERAMRKRPTAANDNRRTARLGIDTWPRVFPSL